MSRSSILIGLMLLHYGYCIHSELSSVDQHKKIFSSNTERFSLLRYIRALNFGNQAPEMSMKSKDNWLTFACTVKNHDIDASVFIFCPPFSQPYSGIQSGGTGDINSDQHNSFGYCYENCFPTKTCNDLNPDTTLNTAKCVPDKQTVNCSQSNRSDGSKVTTIRIDRRDKRLVGLWYCTHAGEKSNSVDVSYEPELVENTNEIANSSEIDAYTSPSEREIPPVNLSSPFDLNIAGRSSNTENSIFTASKVAFMSPFANPPWNFLLLGVFSLSLSINIIFCVRQCMLSIFMEKMRKSDSAGTKLGCMLCLPAKYTKENSILWDNELFAGNEADYRNFKQVNDYPSSLHTLRSLRSGFIIESQIPYENTGHSFVFPNGTIRSMGRHEHSRTAAFNMLYPEQNDWQTMQSAKLQSLNGSMQAGWRPNFHENPIPAPSQYLNERPPAVCSPLINNLPKNAQEFSNIAETSQHLLSGASQNPSLHTVYDDLASSSSAQMSSRGWRNQSSSNACPTYLPRMVEDLQAEDVCTIHKSNSNVNFIGGINEELENKHANDMYALHGNPQF